MSKLEFEIIHFLVILVLLLLNFRGCGGQPPNSKFILKVKSQMANPNAHINVPFLTQITVLVGKFGFQSMSDHYERPCISKILLFFFSVSICLGMFFRQNTSEWRPKCFCSCHSNPEQIIHVTIEAKIVLLQNRKGKKRICDTLVVDLCTIELFQVSG